MNKLISSALSPQGTSQGTRGLFVTLMVLVLTLAPLQAKEIRFSVSNSMDEINAALAGAQPGDSILLERGSAWTGPLLCKTGGSAGAPVVIGTWGSGPAPVIRDLESLTSWEPAGTELWKAKTKKNRQKEFRLNMLIRKNTQLALGREPDAQDPWGGYLPMGKAASAASISPPDLAPGVDWTGAEAVLRSRRWILDRVTVKSSVQGTLSFASKASYEPYETFGFFVQNHPACLDHEGEWAWDNRNRELLLYSSTPPAGGDYRYPTLPVLADLRKATWLVVDGLAFEGSNETIMRVDNSKGLVLRDCRFSLAGQDALMGYDTEDLQVQHCTFEHTQNNAIHLGNAQRLQLQGNRISHTAIVAGMGKGSDGQYNAIQVNGRDILVEENMIFETGYIPICFGGDHVRVRHNVVDTYATVKDDAGGIYTWSDGKKGLIDREIVENLVRRGRGSPNGQSWDGTAVQGIYIDDRSNDVAIRGNIIHDIGESGIFIHNGHEIKVEGNAVYDCGIQISFSHDPIASDHPVINCLIQGNTFCAARPEQTLCKIQNSDDDEFVLPVFSGNSWQSPFRKQAVFALGPRNQAIRNLGIQELTGPGTPDPAGTVNAVFREAKVLDDAASPNLVEDGSFTRGISSWGFWSNRDAGKASTSTTPDKVNAARLSFPKPSKEADSMLLFNSAPFGMVKGTWYSLSFRARASEPDTRVTFLTRRNGDPWTQSTEEQNWSIGTEYETCRALFQSRVTEGESRAEFVLRQADLVKGSTSSTVDITDVVLKQVSVKPVDYRSHSLLIYNAGQETNWFVPGPGWMDTRGPVQDGMARLEPWQAAILIDQ